MAEPNGRVLVVTGSGRGIGRVVSVLAAERGYRVVGLDVDAETGAETARIVTAAGGDARFYPCDVSDPAAIAAVFESIGDVDVLVNNAARGSHTAPEEISAAEWNSVVAVSLGSMVFASQAVARSMIARGRGGAIVNLSSIGGVAALGRGNFAYSIAKAGIIGMTREHAVEWAGHGIRVNAVAPAQVNTEGFAVLIDNADVAQGNTLRDALRGIPLGRLAEPEDVAAAILFLAGDDAAFITGVTLPVDGGSLALHAGGTVRSVTTSEDA